MVARPAGALVNVRKAELISAEKPSCVQFYRAIKAFVVE